MCHLPRHLATKKSRTDTGDTVRSRAHETIAWQTSAQNRAAHPDSEREHSKNHPPPTVRLPKIDAKLKNRWGWIDPWPCNCPATPLTVASDRKLRSDYSLLGTRARTRSSRHICQFAHAYITHAQSEWDIRHWYLRYGYQCLMYPALKFVPGTFCFRMSNLKTVSHCGHLEA